MFALTCLVFSDEFFLVSWLDKFPKQELLGNAPTYTRIQYEWNSGKANSPIYKGME